MKSKNDNTKTDVCKAMHSIMIFICGTGPAASSM